MLYVTPVKRKRKKEDDRQRSYLVKMRGPFVRTFVRVSAWWKEQEKSETTTTASLWPFSTREPRPCVIRSILYVQYVMYVNDIMHAKGERGFLTQE